MEAKFPNLSDLTYLFALGAEQCERFFPVIAYRRLINARFFDELHREASETSKVFAADIPLYGYVVPADETHPLSILGVERVRDLSLFVTVPHLIRTGLATQNSQTREVRLIAHAGDRFVYSNGVVYDILEWRLGPPYANTDVPLLYQAKCEIFRPDSDELEPQADEPD